jgi:hypothetical protein
MIDGYLHPEFGSQQSLARSGINQPIGRIRRPILANRTSIGR